MPSDLDTESPIVQAGRDLRKHLIQCPYFTVEDTTQRAAMSLHIHRNCPWLVNHRFGCFQTAMEDRFLVCKRKDTLFSY